MSSFKQHMLHFRKIPRMLKKNFTLIFRNWSSFLLLIVGPLVLMFLIGIVFSTYNWAGVTVGVVHENENVTSQFADPISQIFGVAEFTNQTDCVNGIVREQITICIVLSDSFSQLTKNEFSVDNLPAGKVSFIYDNSKTLISEAVIGFMRAQFGLTADQIAVEGIAQLLRELEGIEDFLQSSSSEMGQYLTSLEELNSGINTFDQTLTTAITQFDAVYSQLNQTKSELAQTNKTVQQQIWELDNTLSESDAQLADIEDILTENKESYEESKGVVETNLNTLKSFKETFSSSLSDEAKAALNLADIDRSLDVLESDDYTKLEDELDETLSTIANVRSKISEYESISGDAAKELPRRISEFNSLVDQAGQMNNMLKQTQGFVKQLKTFTGTSLDSLGGLQDTLDATKNGFKDLENIDARDIVSPVSIEPKPLVDNESAVYLLFPLIIPIIVVFLSVLFSNIIMLDEIYSKAQMRNFILPVHDIYFVIAFFITNWIIVLFQISMLFLFAKVLLGLDVLNSFFSLLLISLLLSSVFILVGMIYAYVATSKENSILISTFSTVGILFLSDGFVPSELMSPTVAFFVKLNPLVVAESAYRIILFHDVSFMFILGKIVTLLAYVLVFFFILFIFVHKHRHWYHERG